ncbi:unnamed protein product [Allacma fusca]|uniref:Glucose-methanol-choline oxidoreductase N-terminal domain-containing protein n=1 Tax=Allacma fusca TaxID=39272 RepID=A0A8J2KKF6_9HEXA|nr:unnamed protein product [Allacma fusca]
MALFTTAGFMTTGLWMLPIIMGMMGYMKYDSIDPEVHPRPARSLEKEYDFIIVGGGSAGSVLANRLSEIPHWNVLLLEAGGVENEISDVPAVAAYLQMTKIDWQFKTEPQPGACMGLKDQRCNWPRGKVLGGSSVLNYMLYVRGNRRDYDGWEALGNPGWGYDSILKYFKKSEDNRNPYLANNEYHSAGGYLTVQEAPWRTPLATAFVEAGMEMGYENRDGNGEFQSGFMIAQGTIRRGSRCSAAKAFIRPVRNRPNLHIAMESHVMKVLIDENKRAYGVRFRRDGRVQTVRAKREVIISSGAINSPQILMLSGIGPAQHLQEMGIPVVKDAPTGQNLQDHIGFGGLVFLVDQPISMMQSRYENLASVMQYAMYGAGPLTILGGVEGLAWVNTKYANASDDFPDIEFHFIAGSVSSDGGKQVKKAHGVTDKMYNEMFRPIQFRDTWSVVPMLLRPYSAGYLKLRSTNPFDKVLIYPNYMLDRRDAQILVEGTKIAIAMSQTSAFQKLNSRLNPNLMPGCKHLEPWSDDYWECAISVVMTVRAKKVIKHNVKITVLRDSSTPINKTIATSIICRSGA